MPSPANSRRVGTGPVPAAKTPATGTTTSVLKRRRRLSSPAAAVVPPQQLSGRNSPASRRGSATSSSPRSPSQPSAAVPPAATTPESVKLALLRVSESVEAAVAALDKELPTLLSTSTDASAAAEAAAVAEANLGRMASLSPPRMAPTEIAFGRHTSPPRVNNRPGTPPPQRSGASSSSPTRRKPREDGLPHCDNYCSRGATVWCEQCEIEICPLCDASIHGPHAAMRKHTRVHLIDRLPVCSAHREACRLFCAHCIALVCQQCVASATHKFPDGRGHPCFDCDEAADSRRPEIVELAATLRTKAGNAPQVLAKLQAREIGILGDIDRLGERLHAAVELTTARLREELKAFSSPDDEKMTKFIASTDTARRRLLLDADLAESVASQRTPPQTFLSQWRELRGLLIESARAGLGQEEPVCKMHGELTGQVQCGRHLTLEMEVQRVIDALNKCGTVSNLPHGRHIVVLQPSPERPER